MWSNQPKQELAEPCAQLHNQPLEQSKRSATKVLVGLAASFAASWNASNSGACSQCGGYRELRVSTAQHPHAFCSAQCEEEFVLTALGVLSLDDCIRIQQRLEQLLRDARWDMDRC